MFQLIPHTSHSIIYFLKLQTGKNLDFLSSEHERFRGKNTFLNNQGFNFIFIRKSIKRGIFDVFFTDSSRCSLVPSSISKKVCEFCAKLAEKTTTHLSVCNVYCPRVKRFLCV